ncbi:hypothetical protein P8V03_03840 [Clostridium sp. A1-XYC3]|uniref:DUF86 domain-containing protein n=1 Tax=Clostridium tanneri TaxID=3037988 RepID=A0ABU4JQ95_9CLOT|nr:hypothetical protein [Clostridium sp. A1-XYC3]MDW8800281.1 hypothetical protein [Clostridium sp. A1-XYC3]
MINRDRTLKLISDFKEWEQDFKECLASIDSSGDKIKKFLYHSIRAYFLDFHILCEDYISITLKYLNKFKIDISAIEGMEIIKNSNKVSEEFFEFYSSSRKLRNRLAHRYKMPKDEDLLLNLKDNVKYLEELEEALKELLK